MHQIRYFLAVSRTLNVTQAAQECNVAQPSMTRAIKKLEDELGGELFRRERQRTHLTELGRMMLPLLQRCLEGAQEAKALAGSLQSGSYAPLQIGLSRTVDLAQLLQPLTELVRSLPGLELWIARGTAPEIAEWLESGAIELAIAGPLERSWERLNAWVLAKGRFALFVHPNHPWANRRAIEVESLEEQRLLTRPYCEQATLLDSALRRHGVEQPAKHEMAADADVLALLAANAGIAILPEDMRHPILAPPLALDGLDLEWTRCLYDVAGRQRSVAAAALIKLLRSAASA